MEHTPQPDAHPRRRLPRWAWALILLLLPAGGWFLADGLRLRPMTARTIPSNCSLHFSMNGCGYPAVEGPTDKGKGVYDFTARWLDDDGRPRGGPFVLHSGKWAVSPERTAVAYTTPMGGRTEVGVAWRDGRRALLELPRRVPKLLAASDDGRFHDGRELFDLRGEAVVTPPEPLEFAAWVQSVDPRYVILRHWRQSPADLIFFDTVSGKRLWTTTRSARQAGIVFHAGNDFLLVPRVGLAQRFTADAPSGSMGTASGNPLPWWWGEDGTVWTIYPGAVQVLDWQQGALLLRALPVTAVEDPRIRRLENRADSDSRWYAFPPPPYAPSPGLAVWGGGRLVATAESQSIWPSAFRRPLQPVINRYRRLQRERRVLTLYRDGRKAGRFAIPLDPHAPLETGRLVSVTRGSGSGVIPPVIAREHIAFNKDGTRLAWVVETVKGKSIYVFRVPR